MIQKLAITDVVSPVTEPEPVIVEITVVLEDSSRAVLRMNGFTLQKLFAVIKDATAA
jgi:hypothetical protein